MFSLRESVRLMWLDWVDALPPLETADPLADWDRVPDHYSVEWSHPLAACGPILHPEHPEHAQRRTPWDHDRSPDPAAVAEWLERPRTRHAAAPTAALRTSLRCRYSFRIPATRIRGVDPLAAHIPPASLVCDPDPAAGLSARAVALTRWQAHAAPHIAAAVLDDLAAHYVPHRLPRGTVTRYLSAAQPLHMVKSPPLLPDPWPAPAPLPWQPEDLAPAEPNPPEPQPQPHRNPEDVHPAWLELEDAEAPRDKRTNAWREYIATAADAQEAGRYDPAAPWRQVLEPQRRENS